MTHPTQRHFEEALAAYQQATTLDPRNPGGLYVAGTRYKSDDFAPYLYKTADYGATWTKITNGIDPLHFTRTIEPGGVGEMCDTSTDTPTDISPSR